MITGGFVIMLSILMLIIGLIISTMHYYKVEERRFEQSVCNPEYFCYQHCKIYEQTASEYKDPDDVWKAMDNAEHCVWCPIYAAQMIIAKQDEKERERENESTGSL